MTAIFTDAEAYEAQARDLTAALTHAAAPVVIIDETAWRLHTMLRIEDLLEYAEGIRMQIRSSIEHIRNYYGLDLSVGLDVEHDGRPGKIVGFSGQYVVVRIKGEDHTTTCHATAEMKYPQHVHIGPGPDERFAHLVETTG